jgi:hypothetical protein
MWGVLKKKQLAEIGPPTFKTVAPPVPGDKDMLLYLYTEIL